MINSNALAFHKTHQEERIVYEDKNLLKDDIQSKYCAKKVKQHNIKDEESGHKSQEETEDGKLGWEVYGSHYLKIKIKLGEKIILAVLGIFAGLMTFLQKVLWTQGKNNYGIVH